MMNRRMLLLAAASIALAAQAQEANYKIAVSSLVADSLTVTDFERGIGTRLPKPPRRVDMPTAALDISVMQSAQAALQSALPRATVALLKVPRAGSSVDPALTVAEGKVVADNVLVQALRQQGFTHLLTATRLRAPNQVRLMEGHASSEQAPLEGLGFYMDPRIRLQDTASGHTADGLVAPYLYVELRLLDLASMTVQSSRAITATEIATTAKDNEGLSGWDALTPAQRVDTLERLIDRNVPAAVLDLLPAR